MSWFRGPDIFDLAVAITKDSDIIVGRWELVYTGLLRYLLRRYANMDELQSKASHRYKQGLATKDLSGE